MMMTHAIPQQRLMFLHRRPPPFIPRPMFPPPQRRLLPRPMPLPALLYLRQQQQRHYHLLSQESADSIGVDDMDTNKIIIRQVWASNRDYEFGLIAQLIEKFPYVSVDTEFPGVIFKPRDNHRNLLLAEKYRLLKLNVDALNLIQVGLTFSDKDGNLPDLGTDGKRYFIWQFNFRDFNAARDAHAVDSVALLHRQGIDFPRNAVAGVSSARFAELAAKSGLVCNDRVTWVTFHGAYDFGYLVKILTRRFLPKRLEDFMLVLGELFGRKVYDVKHVAQFCNGLYGGLERMGQTLNVDRVAGKSHQAGSDSLLTSQVFHKIGQVYFVDDEHVKHANKLFGL